MRVSKSRVKKFWMAPALKGRAWCWVLALAVLALPARASAVDSAVIRSFLVPGLGQAHQGHYTRATIYAGSAVLSGFGLLVAQVYYNEAVDKYRTQQGIYASYSETLANGGVVSIEDMRNTYATMESEHEACEDRLVWRNVFIGTLVATYAINIVDVLISKPYDPDEPPTLSLEVAPESFRVTKTFRF